MLRCVKTGSLWPPRLCGTAPGSKRRSEIGGIGLGPGVGTGNRAASAHPHHLAHHIHRKPTTGQKTRLLDPACGIGRWCGVFFAPDLAGPLQLGVFQGLFRLGVELGAVLLQLYERLSQSTPASIEGLLQLKQQVADGLEEYYGATLVVTRFGDAVAEDGERLLGIVELYDALMDRLETVSFALTTRYQQRMTQMQFWLTVVFGATEIGFIAASIATWHYRSELGAVLAWTVGATVVSAGGLVALLRRLMEKP